MISILFASGKLYPIFSDFRRVTSPLFLYNSEFGVIQHDFFLTARFKIDRRDRIVRRSFHLRHFAISEFLVFNFIARCQIGCIAGREIGGRNMNSRRCFCIGRYISWFGGFTAFCSGFISAIISAVEPVVGGTRLPRKIRSDFLFRRPHNCDPADSPEFLL